MTGPDIRYAQAGKKSKASDYNHNFDEMVGYIDTIAGGLTDYVNSYMPSQTGNAGKLLTTNGTSASWVNFGGNLPSGSYIEGLIITKSGDSTIAVSKGSCYDNTRIKILTLGSNTTKQNESQAASATYYVYIIGTSTTGIDILISTSADAPTLPSGYVYYRQIGSYATGSDSKINSISSYGIDSSASHITEFSPDYSATITLTKENGTTTKKGYLVFNTVSNTYDYTITIGGVTFYDYPAYANQHINIFPVDLGVSYSVSNWNRIKDLLLIPIKGAI